MEAVCPLLCSPASYTVTEAYLSDPLRFAPVQAAFEDNLARGLENGVQFVVYKDGQKIIDLAGHVNKPVLAKYGADSVQIVFSCSKVVTSLVIAYLVQNEVLDYKEKISTYWPEFAQHGKGEILLEEMMRHEGGLPLFKNGRQMTAEMLTRRPDLLKSFLAEQEPIWNFQSQVKKGDRIYHAVTRGYYLSEIAKCADSMHRSVGEILLEDIVPLVKASAEKSGNKDMLRLGYGLLHAEEEVKADHHMFERYSIWSMMKGFIYKTYLRRRKGRSDDPNEKDPQILKCRKTAKENSGRGIKGRMNALHVAGKFGFRDDAKLYMMEAPSSNCTTNARSLAMFANEMLFNGNLLTEETKKKFYGDPVVKYDLLTGRPTVFTTGGISHFKNGLYDPCVSGFFGWSGMGGSVFAFNPEENIVVAYTPTKLNLTSMGGFDDERCLKMMRLLTKLL